MAKTRMALRRIHLTEEELNFVSWLEETLIPDLHDSGTEETAKDFERLIRIVDGLCGVDAGRERRQGRTT